MVDVSINKIPLRQTGLFDNLILDYLENKDSAKDFYELNQSVDSIFEKVRTRNFSENNRVELVKALEQQYGGKETLFPKVWQNIMLLKESSTFTITTGHQLNLFTGPLYFFYKIFTTIKLANSLNNNASKQGRIEKFVPIYWMHVEDHDFDEINHFSLFGKIIEWNRLFEDKRMSGDIGTGGMEDVFKEFQSLAGNSELAEELVALFKRIYTENSDLKSATFCLANELFSEYGLVVLDPSSTELKRLFVPYLKQEFENGDSFRIVNNTNRLLEGKGYKVIVNPREINVFFTGVGFRERIVKTDNGFEVLNQNICFSKEQILQELDFFPERFSPNVVLRPLFQEIILPNCAYVGGAGELGYWMQYKQLFKNKNISYPVLWLRNSILWIDKNIAARMNRLGISNSDLFLATEDLVSKFVLANIEKVDLGSEKEELSLLLDKILDAATKLDRALETSAKAEIQRIKNSIESLETKMFRASKSKLETQVSQIKKMKQKLFPNGFLQERTENFSQFYLVYGKLWFDIIFESIDPLDSSLLLITESE